jgi:DNA helicase-4
MLINGYELDEYQMNAIKSNHEATLVIAGAGSGKTLTILGKIKYLIDNNIKQDEILCISFTNETTKSLKNKLLEMNYDIDVYTFHKLGLSMLDNKYSIVKDSYLKYVINEYFKSYIKYNKRRNRILKNILYDDCNIDKIFKSFEYNRLVKTIITFIKLAKSNDFSIKDIYKIYNKTFFNERHLIKIILEIYILYKRELESSNQIDFDDMIILAKDKVKDKHLKYKYIIIDEFQDTSIVRFNLILEIIKYTKAKLFVVGDDYQSIYRFSGCDLNLFLNFNKYFKDTKYYYLKYTYRNSNQLIKVSVSFIMKNKKQLKKNIESIKNNLKPIKIVFNKTIDDIINRIDKDYLIIGRNNKDIDKLPYDNKLTIHRSKGLEANNVILVNSESIPTSIKNERILRFVLNNKDYILHEEERRLFYVALTRTKNNIYIMVNKKMSPFVKELIHDYSNYIEIIF